MKVMGAGHKGIRFDPTIEKRNPRYDVLASLKSRQTINATSVEDAYAEYEASARALATV